MPETPLTAIILTFNEEINIVRCLNCLDWADDVVIVDSGSADRTLELAAQARPDIRVFTHPFKDFGDQRNWALDNVQPKHEWVLFVDADEFCVPELAREIGEYIRSPGDTVGAFIAGKNHFMGKWLRHSGLYPSYQLRLLKMGAVRYRKEGHGQREVTDGKAAFLKEGWIHEGFSKGLTNWLDKHNRYSTEEVDLMVRLRSEPPGLRQLFSKNPLRRRECMKRMGAKLLPLMPLLRFGYRYGLRGGFLDGKPGFLFSLLYASVSIQVVAKVYEAERNRTPMGDDRARRPSNRI
ncbi:glycosyl transferase, family 2 [Syntrophobacter fumaroxidans MPOB]|uniref:Glycosyl transferase, family 2 n=1 Tax=Syntrophobacter fumaroxidans (strain DSM 10017 / MPOB) TaxID=335543 RepID=A0LNK5_SYNFM|nr:glycosyl transferase, family 2 [Syntrophobacter fumaroxidans MPOB]